jgi:phage-related tail fiber protein
MSYSEEHMSISMLSLNSSMVPTGGVIFTANWLVGQLPTGFLLADGSAYSRTTYARLFAVIGTTFGAGDGSTTFNVPNLGDDYVRNWSDNGITDSGRALGSFQAYDWKSFYTTNTLADVSSGYSHGPVWMGKSTSGYVGNLFTGEWAGPAAVIGTAWTTDKILPESIVMLAAIKY